jgi:hypothetical protein
MGLVKGKGIEIVSDKRYGIRLEKLCVKVLGASFYD